MIRAYYNSENSNIIEGYYPEELNYKKFPDLPFIKISKKVHQNFYAKQAFVLKGEVKEYVEPENETFKSIYEQKKNEIIVIRKELQFSPIIYNSSEFSSSKTARQNIANTILMAASSSQNKNYWQDLLGKDYQFDISDFRKLLQSILDRDSRLYHIEVQINKELKKQPNLKSISSFNARKLWKIHDKNYSLSNCN